MTVADVESLQQFETFLRDNEFVVVDFWATWCGPCKKFKPTYKKLSQEEKYKDVVFLAVECEEQEEIAGREKVTSFPTFKLYRDGEVVSSFSGANEEKLRKALENLL